MPISHHYRGWKALLVTNFVSRPIGSTRIFIFIRLHSLHDIVIVHATPWSNFLHVQVKSFQEPSSTMTVNPGGGLTWSLSGAGISLHGDWRVRYSFIFPVDDSGTFDATASGASISVSATLSTTAAGEPTIKSTGCTCHIDRVNIVLHGEDTSLYSRFMGPVETNMRNSLQQEICDEAQNAINMDVAAGYLISAEWLVWLWLIDRHNVMMLTGRFCFMLIKRLKTHKHTFVHIIILWHVTGI